MNRYVPNFLAVVSIVAFSGVAALAAPASGPSMNGDQAREDLLNSNSASQRNDWTLAASLAEKSYKAKPDMWNEFNLATAYQRSARGELAVPLYLDIVDRGQFVRTNPIPSLDGSRTTPMLPFMADEAALRLKKMGVDLTPERTPVSAVLATRLIR